MNNVALQIECTIPSIIDDGNNIIFNDIVYSSGNVIYSPINGEITFTESGRYIINWWVATQSALQTNSVNFALSSSQGDFINGNSPVKTGQVYGSGIIDVALSSAPVTLKLVNATSGKVSLSTNIQSQASLVIVQDKSYPPVGLSDTTLCFAYSQLAHILGQIIQFYSDKNITIFTTNLSQYTAKPYQLYSSSPSNGPGLFIINGDDNSLLAFTLSCITAIYVGDDAVYNPSITYLTPPDPLPKGCDTDLITSVKEYIPVGSSVSITLGIVTTASGEVYKNEYGILVLSDVAGSTPVFIPPLKIISIAID